MQRNAWYAVGLLLGVPALLTGQGFGVYEHGTCTMGRAGTAAASPCPDGSAIFFNPAGLAGLSGTRLSAGVTLIAAHGNFTDDVSRNQWDLDNPIIPVPNFYLTRAFTPKLTAGIGVFVPYGLETKWGDAAAYDPVTDSFRTPDEVFPGRFLGWNSKLQSIYIQPTIGYQIHPRVQVGIGVAYILGKVELKQRVDFSQQVVPSASVPPGTTFSALGIPTGTDFAEARLEADGNGIAVNVGAIWQATDQLAVGAHYLSRSTIDYSGTAEFTQIETGLILPAGNPLSPTGSPLPVDAVVAPLFAAGGPLSDGAATTSITMPDQLTLGVAWQANERWKVLVDWHRVMWHVFDQLELDFENAASPDLTLNEEYKNTNGFRFGLEFARSATMTFRGGYLYHQGAAPAQTVTPLLPEGARNEFTIGLGWQVSPKLKADFGYQYIRQDDRRGRVFDETVGNTGLYVFKAHLVGAGLSYTF
jgi:long-chain fatty acid transport protein